MIDQARHVVAQNRQGVIQLARRDHKRQGIIHAEIHPSHVETLRSHAVMYHQLRVISVKEMIQVVSDKVDRLHGHMHQDHTYNGDKNLF